MLSTMKIYLFGRIESVCPQALPSSKLYVLRLLVTVYSSQTVYIIAEIVYRILCLEINLMTSSFLGSTGIVPK